jgi:hypothetical protein
MSSDQLKRFLENVNHAFPRMAPGDAQQIHARLAFISFHSVNYPSDVFLETFLAPDSSLFLDGSLVSMFLGLLDCRVPSARNRIPVIIPSEFVALTQGKRAFHLSAFGGLYDAVEYTFGVS